MMLELPRYRCHKEVHALKIATVTAHPEGTATLFFKNSDFAPRVMPAAFVCKHAPLSGGYLVIYEDGYESWSPADAFEAGYTEIFADGTDTVIERDGTVRGEPLPDLRSVR